MSRKRQLLPKITEISTKIIRKFLQTTKKQLIWLLRTISGTQKRQKTANAGFVLPTVAMISIVVVLLTTAIMIRSFERAKNASNVRINQAAISSATPAIDRGRAKINQLFADKTLPRATPTDQALYTIFQNKIEDYTFGDETPLKLSFDIDGDNTIDTPTSSTKIYDNENLVTAWRFPVDTDNNGKFDSYTLYGIYFRTPKVGTDNKYARARNPLEARTPPMAEGTLDANCSSNTSALLVGSTGWVKQNSELKKSFFVYTTTVPITSTPTDTTNYEKYNGNKGFAAVEYQQDRLQVPPNNNAVVYEDDLEITPGVDLNLNGAIFTNSNLLTRSEANVRIYQVSSTKSCFYKASNGFIVVGGNLSDGRFTNSSTLSGNDTKIDLFNGATTPTTKDWDKSVTQGPSVTAYNNLAYVNRINKLIDAQIAADSTGANDPTDVKNGIAKKSIDLGIALTSGTADFTKYRRQQLELYFKKRTRRVPFAEVAFGGTDTDPTNLLQGSGDTLRADDKWIYPTNPSDWQTGTGYTTLSLAISGATLKPQAVDPVTVKANSGKQTELGDRVLLGQNLPEIWWDPNNTKANKFVGPAITDTQDIKDVTWKSSTKTRTRRTLVQTLQDVGDTSRDGPWELDAAKVPQEITEPVGGLRVVTGAGVYLSASDTTTSVTSTVKEIWPDTMPTGNDRYSCPSGIQCTISSTIPTGTQTTKTNKPFWMYAYMTGTSAISDIAYKLPYVSDTNYASANTPYLKMRATAVYHYKSTNYNAQTPKPIACVSSFYDPSNSISAQNINTFATKTIPGGTATGKSNNGIVYGPPTKSATDYATVLGYLKDLKYPVTASGKTKVVDTAHASYLTGRLIDDGLLARALAKTTASDRTISEQSAIDAQICALQILDGSISPDNSVIPHNAIREIALLDAREIERNSGNDLTTAQTTTYDRPIIDRQPLEVRATVLDLNLLRTTTIGNSSPSQEYLLPNSGIIYATRDDALPDASAGTTEAAKLVSPVDYKIDPYRRPNGIMLINGSALGRTSTYRDEEKGLILATNLPVYIKGDFNLHSNADGVQEEFTDALDSTWSNFYTRTTLNPNFACRKNDPRLPDCDPGDDWRPATVLADAVTLLSGSYREGVREDGDYDWSHNNLASVPNSGFSKFNNFVTVSDWKTRIATGSSYLNNFVTPIALQTIPASYLTEACVIPTTQDPNTYCNNPLNWKIQIGNSCNDTAPASNGNNSNNYLHGGIIGDTSGVTGTTVSNKIKTGFIFQEDQTVKDQNGNGNGNCFAGSNVVRRLALLRTTDGKVVSPLKVLAVAKGNGNVGNVEIFDFGADKSNSNNDMMPPPNNAYASMPWLKPTISSSTGQITALVPVLQIQQPFATPSDPNNTTIISGENKTTSTPKESTDTNNWLQSAPANTTFNLIVAAGDSPARPTEDNGGLHNFVRFLENWQPTAGQMTANILGSFMQVKKSAYATGTYTVNVGASSVEYPIKISGGSGTGYQPPLRNWGYDVALLSQSPDQFANKLVLTPPNAPDEYFREVGRDDKWVSTLLCAKTNAATPVYAIDTDQRPSSCKS